MAPEEEEEREGEALSNIWSDGRGRERKPESIVTEEGADCNNGGGGGGGGGAGGPRRPLPMHTRGKSFCCASSSLTMRRKDASAVAKKEEEAERGNDEISSHFSQAGLRDFSALPKGMNYALLPPPPLSLFPLFCALAIRWMDRWKRKGEERERGRDCSPFPSSFFLLF